MNNRYFKQALRAGLIVGTLDISAACIQFWLKTGKNPLIVPRFVASGAFGKEAMSGGAAMIGAGFIFHYFIATCFAVFFFWLVAKMPVLTRQRIITGILYGIFMSVVMQLVVVPLSRTAKQPFHIANALAAASILIVCIGIPLAFMATRSLAAASARSALPA